MKIKNILTLILTILFMGAAQAAPLASKKKQIQKPAAQQNVQVVYAAAACPDVKHSCPDFCAEAERALKDRISWWQDPLLADQKSDEAERLKRLCRQQEPGYAFPDERALPQQEMAEVD